MRRFVLAFAGPPAVLASLWELGMLTIAGAPIARAGNTLAASCMRVTYAVRAHPEVLLLAMITAIAVLGGLGALTAVMQLRRTTAVLHALSAARLERVPGGVTLLIARLGLAGRVDVIDKEELFAFACRLRGPRLMLSRGLIEILNDAELEAVLRHEHAHLRGRDPLRVLVARSLSAALAFVPWSRGAFDAYLCSRELAADRAAVHGMGDVVPLASALRRVLLAGGGPGELASLAVGSLSATDIRIDRLLGIETSPQWLLVPASRLHALAFSLLFAASLCVLISVAYAAGGIRPCIPCG